MKKMFLYFVLPLLMCMATGYAQTLSVHTYGQSPRDVERDSVITPKFFDVPYNGLQNVGVETKVFLKAEMEEGKLNSPVWSFTAKPTGSTVTFGTTRDLDTSNQAIYFIPDIKGTYKITVTDGSLSSEITINASLYKGMEIGACYLCHNGMVSPDPIYSKWEGTGHATMLQQGLDGIASSHYGESCIECHTTGYDANANNGGFDDWPFTFPTVLQAGMYDSMKVAYPEAMAFANIQCESCHGPGANHYGATSDEKIAKTLSSDNCAFCHDEGTHHYLPEQADHSVHSNPTTLEEGTRSSCAQCHSGSGFVAWVKGGKTALTSAPEPEAIQCGVCHDPHDATNAHQVRTVNVTFQNGVTPDNAGTGALCMNCHQARRDAVAYTDDYLNNLSSHYGPHHGPQGDMLAGTNGIDFGWKFPTSPHLAATENSCVDCHMTPEGANTDGTIKQYGSHSLNMVDPVTGNDNVEACAPCHGTIGTKFSDKKYYVNGNADLDKDGTVEGLQEEIKGMLEKLALLLPPVNQPEVSITDSSVTLVQAQAAYNYFFVEEDRSLGIHNPAYAYTLLAVSMQKLDPTTDLKPIDGTMPQDYSLEQNYPNPFNPTTKIKFTIPKEGNVKLEIYDITGRLVNTVVNQYMSSGSYTITWDGKNSAGSKVGSGVYLYRINAGNFVQVKKMVLMK